MGRDSGTVCCRRGGDGRPRQRTTLPLASGSGIAAFFWRYVRMSPTATARSMLGQILVFVIGVMQGSGTSRCGHGRSRCLSLADSYLFPLITTTHPVDMTWWFVFSGGHLHEPPLLLFF